jgi:uncharacterized lipoprotein YmbA
VTNGKTKAAHGATFAGMALVVSLVTGCSSPDPLLYRISPVDGVVRSSAAKVIMLERVEIARYLDRSQIVGPSESYRLDVKSNDWWGEPLGAMLQRVLRQELAQRLPQSVVVTERGGIAASADATIDVDVQRLDADPSGTVVLQAQASVSLKGSRTPVLRSFRFSVPAASGTATEVAAISTAVGQLADGLALMLIGR